jgi:hypothetical protein
MKIGAVLLKTIFCIVVVLGAISASFFWLVDPMYLKAPSDHELTMIFQSHRVAFDKLRQMVTEDSITYVSESHIDGHLSGERIIEYKRLLSEIDPGLVITMSRFSVRFRFASGGLSAIGPEWMKGIEYTADPLREGVIVKSLDQPSSLAMGGVYLHQIEAKWYLILQKTD